VALRAGALFVAMSLSAVAAMPLDGPTTSVVGQRSQRLTLRTDDGVSIAATWYDAPQRPAPAVILVHMLTRSRRDWERVAPTLAAEGVGALTIDLRGHGESSGDSGDVTAMLKDITAAKRFLTGRPDVVHARMGIAGASLGANLAVLAAADDPAVGSLVLLSPSLEYRGLRIEAPLRKYGKRPALLVAGDDDGYALRTVRELAKGSGGIRELLVLPGAGHGTNMFTHAPELPGQLVGWFRRTLQ
jgi:pimeloyl-ACP methyl ester carboxylesterase